MMPNPWYEFFFCVRFVDRTDFVYIQQAFACLVTLQLLHSFLSRSIHLSVFETGILSNRWMILAGLVSFAFLIMGIYVPGNYTA